MRLEDNLLLSCLKFNINSYLSGPIDAALKSKLDFDYFFDKACQEGVASIVYTVLNQPQFKAKLNSEVLNKFSNTYYSNLSKNTLIFEESNRIFESLEKNKVKALKLKGLFLAQEIYGNIALRPVSDLDIFIRKSDLISADKALTALGYISPPYFNDFLVFKSDFSLNALVYRHSIKSGYFIHLHWNLINTTWPIKSLAAKLSSEALFRTNYSNVDGDLILPPEQQLIYLAQHAFNHSFDRLLLLYDIALVLNYYHDKLDWDLLFKKAKEYGLILPVYYSFLAVSKIFHLKLNHFKELFLKELKPADKMISSLFLNGQSNYWLSYLVYFYLQKGLKEKGSFILKTILPDKLVIAHDFNLSLNEVKPAHYLSRLFKNTRGCRQS